MRNSIFPKWEPRSNSWLFSFSWEQRELGDIGKTYTGLSGKTKEDFGHGAGSFVTYMNVFSNPIADGCMTENVELDSSQTEVKYGDVFFTTSSETPEEVGMSSVWLNNSKATYLNSFCFGYRLNEKLFDLYFLAYLLRASDFRKNMTFLAQGISRYNISKNKVMEISVSVPQNSEQQKIGQYFKSLDRLITLHQCKPFFRHTAKGTETVRAAFSWEQRKVREVTEDYVEKTVIQNQYPVLTSSQQQGIVLQEKYFADRQVTTSENIGYFVLPRGFFTYRSRSDTDVFVFNRNMLIDKGIISKYYPVFSAKDTVPEFLLRRLNFGIRKQLSMAAEGTGQKVLAHSKFKDMVIVIPEPREQEKIGAFFESLDRLITLHQRNDFFVKASKNLEISLQKTVAWEQRKLEMLASFSKGSGYSKNDILPAGTPIILYGRLYTKYETNISVVDTFADAKAGSVYSRGGEVIVPASGETAEDISIASVVERKGVILGGDLNIITPNTGLNPTFLALTITYGNAHNDLSRFAQGKSVVHLHNSDLKVADIPYPSEKEQQKIGMFFRGLDQLITLHQRERLFLILEEILC